MRGLIGGGEEPWPWREKATVRRRVAAANSGMDMEMPGGVSNTPEYYGPALQTAVQSGQVSMATLNDMVRRLAA